MVQIKTIIPALGLAALAAFTLVAFGQDGSATRQDDRTMVTVVDRPAAATKPAPASTYGGSAPAPAASSPGSTLTLAEVGARLHAMMAASPTKKAMFDALRKEQRDPAWAPEAERRIETAYAALSGIGGRDRQLAVHCGSTLCEVFSDLPVNGRTVNDTMRAVQGPDLSLQLNAAGYGDKGMIFGPSSADNRQVLAAYYRRR